MNDFCVDILVPEACLRAEHGVLRDVALQVTADAGAAADQILGDARNEAEAMLHAARGEADAMLHAARTEARQAVQVAEQQTLERANQLIQMLQSTHDAFLAGAEATVLDLAQGLFDRLVIELTPRQRIAAAYQRVQLEAPRRLVSPLLRVHPDDVDLLPATEWDVKSDLSMTRGVCRLEAASGEWCVDFDAAVMALKAALTASEGPQTP